MAELSRKFRILMEYGWRKLPNHAKESLKKSVTTDPEFLDKIIQKSVTLLSKNYGLPENVLGDSYSVIRCMHDYSFLFDEDYINYRNTGSFCNIGHFLQNVLLSLDYEFSNALDQEKIVLVYNLTRLLQWVSRIDESSVEKNAGMVSRIRDVKSKDKNGNFKFTSARFARAFNQQFPGWPEAFVDALNDVWKDSYGVFDSSKYKIHIGRTEDHFLAAYNNTNLGNTSNITTTIFTKHLNNSCMQYDMDDEDGWTLSARNTGRHCVEAYATTDEDLDGLDYKRYFEIMYVTDSDDPFENHAVIYGRMIFSREPDTGIPEFAPMYVVSNNIKNLMMKAAFDLGKDLTKENRETFEFEFKRFLEKVDNHNSCDYPDVMEGSVFKALKGNSGYQLTIKEFKDKSKNKEDIYLLSPYIDVGSKEGISIPNTKNGNIYISLNSKPLNTFETYNEKTRMYMDDDMGMMLTKTYFSGYEGINILSQGVVKEKCDHCGEEDFGLHTLNTKDGVISVCEKCKTLYRRCYVTGLWSLKENMLQHKYLDVYHSYKAMGNAALVRDIYNALEDTCFELETFIPYVREKDIELYETGVKYIIKDFAFEKCCHINSIVSEKGLFENVIVSPEMTQVIEIDGDNFIQSDIRVCWDMINDKPAIDNNSVIISFINDGFKIDLKITMDSFNIVKEITNDLFVSVKDNRIYARIGTHNDFIVILRHFKELKENSKISEGEMV